MIHKIKALHDNGDGLSSRQIARELGISRNTVRKYLAMDELQIATQLEDCERNKQLDEHIVYIKHQLQNAPGLSAVKLRRRLVKKFDDINVSDRTLRRYVAKLKEQIAVAQTRYYEPVLDMVPGVQCQVDPGELRHVMIGGQPRTIYFVVFVLSYSRLMHVSCSLQPIDTTTFIRMHDAAFRYFGGRPDELVYDQTKLVVLSERYRELELNQRMAQYATEVGYTIRACEGFDPESKGKVEAGVKYVKNNALYDENFRDEAHLQDHLANWLDEVANVRTHGTTGKQPLTHYQADEKAKMQPYFAPSRVHLSGQALIRQVDKTGLISYQSVKYSVPMAWQRQSVALREEGHQLVILTPDQSEELARHTLSTEKGTVVKKTHHYRDMALAVKELEEKVIARLGAEYGGALCHLLKTTSPKIYRDQLSGVLRIIKRLGMPDSAVLEPLCQRSTLTAKGLEEHLEAYQAGQPSIQEASPVMTGALGRYSHLTEAGGAHAFH